MRKVYTSKLVYLTNLILWVKMTERAFPSKINPTDDKYMLEGRPGQNFYISINTKSARDRHIYGWMGRTFIFLSVKSIKPFISGSPNLNTQLASRMEEIN